MPATLFLVENASVPEEPRVWAECRTLRDNGWEATVVCPRGPRGGESVEVVDGVRILRFDSPHPGGGTLGYVAEYASAMRHMRSAVRALERALRFDVIHAANPPDFLLALARRARKRGVATIFDHHDLSPELYEAKYGRRGLGYRALLAAERFGFAAADVVVSANDSFRRIAIERGGKDPADVFVVRNGPDPSTFTPGAADPEVRRDDTHLIGYAGLMGSQDGVIEAIEVLAILRRRRSDWKAIFAGDGEMLAPARDLATERGLADAVEFAGFVRDRARLVSLLSSCDVCISPEPKNPLNDHSTLIKVAEYMAVGRPIVAFDLVETRVTAGDSAAYGETLEDFASAIDMLLDDPQRREQMGRVGRERVLASFSWSASEAALMAAYERAGWRAERR